MLLKQVPYYHVANAHRRQMYRRLSRAGGEVFTWTLFAGTCTRADRKASAALDPDEQADRIQIVEHMTGGTTGSGIR